MIGPEGPAGADAPDQTAAIEELQSRVGVLRNRNFCYIDSAPGTSSSDMGVIEHPIGLECPLSTSGGDIYVTYSLAATRWEGNFGGLMAEIFLDGTNVHTSTPTQEPYSTSSVQNMRHFGHWMIRDVEPGDHIVEIKMTLLGCVAYPNESCTYIISRSSVRVQEED